MTTSWILVANASEAYIYTTPRAKLLSGNSSLKPICEFRHPQSRQKCQSLVTDKQGHLGHGTMVESAEQKQAQADIFAQIIIKALNKARLKNEFDDLILIASPKFDGTLRKHFSSQLDQMISVNIKKDYTHCNENKITQYLQEYL